MAEVLHQAVTADAHERHDPKRDQRHRHNDYLGRGIHMQPCDLGIAHKPEHDDGFDGVPRFEHSAQELAAVRIVRRYGVGIVELLFVHVRYRPIR